MSDSSASQSPSAKPRAARDRAAPLRSWRETWSYFYPLALTMLMMSSSTPIVNAGVSRLSDPVAQLAAFAVAFSISIFFSSLTFGLETTGIALIRGRDSFLRVWGAGLMLGGTLGALEAAFALSPWGLRLFVEAFRLSPEAAASARWSLLLFAPLPALLATRGVFRAVFNYTGHTGAVGLGTLLRLGAMAAVIALGVAAQAPGALLGAAAFLAAVTAETAYLAWHVRRRLPDLPGDGGADPRVASHGRILRFSLPFLASVLVGTSSGLVINLMLSKTAQPELGLAGFALLRSVGWFLSSVLSSSQTLGIARTRDAEETRVALRFIGSMAVGFAGFLLLVSFDPFATWMFGDLLGAQGAVLEECRAVAFWFAPTPFLVAGRMFMRGLMVRNGRTGATLASAVFSLAATTALGWATTHAFVHPSAVGAVMWLSINALDMAALGFWGFWRGWRDPAQRSADAPEPPHAPLAG